MEKAAETTAANYNSPLTSTRYGKSGLENVNSFFSSLGGTFFQPVCKVVRQTNRLIATTIPAMATVAATSKSEISAIGSLADGETQEPTVENGLSSKVKVFGDNARIPSPFRMRSPTP